MVECLWCNAKYLGLLQLLGFNKYEVQSVIRQCGVFQDVTFSFCQAVDL